MACKRSFIKLLFINTMFGFCSHFMVHVWFIACLYTLSSTYWCFLQIAIFLSMNIFICCSVLCVKYLNFLRAALVVLLLCRLMMVWSCQTKLLCVLLRLKMQNIRKTKLNVSSLGTWFVKPINTESYCLYKKKALVSTILTGLFI